MKHEFLNAVQPSAHAANSYSISRFDAIGMLVKYFTNLIHRA